MNNEVAGKTDKKIGALKTSLASNNVIKKLAAQKTTMPNIHQNADKALGFMGVKNTPLKDEHEKTKDGVKESLQFFLENPEYVQEHVDFCDSLLENGYDLKDAIEKTDCVLNILQKKDTYN